MRDISISTSTGKNIRFQSFRGLIRQHETKLSAFARLADAVLIAAALWLTTWLYEMPWRDNYSLALASAIGLFVFFGQFHDLYRSWRGTSLSQEATRLWWAWLGVVLGILLLGFVFKKSADFSRLVMVTWIIATPITLTIWRGALHLFAGLLRQYGLNTRRVAIVGARDLGVQLADTLINAPWMGLTPIGFFDDRGAARNPLNTSDPVKHIGNLNQLLRWARDGKIDVIYITLPMRAEKRIQELIAQLSDTTVSVYLIPDFFMFDLMNASWTNIGELPCVSIYESPFYGVDGVIKRIEDIVLSSLILIVAAIPMLIIAAGIKLTSRGPVLFKQLRYGLQGQPIEVWKFRSMCVQENGDHIPQATRSDPRVTRFGAFLRRTSLDELPQFINVLQGRMSIVGPRPHAVAHNEQYRKLINGYMLRHKVKPGITGWAQVNGLRGETETVAKMAQRVEHDLAYIRNWSLTLDLKIIAKTAVKIFTDRNAY